MLNLKPLEGKKEMHNLLFNYNKHFFSPILKLNLIHSVLSIFLEFLLLILTGNSNSFWQYPRQNVCDQ